MVALEAPTTRREKFIDRHMWMSLQTAKHLVSKTQKSFHVNKAKR